MFEDRGILHMLYWTAENKLKEGIFHIFGIWLEYNFKNIIPRHIFGLYY